MRVIAIIVLIGIVAGLGVFLWAESLEKTYYRNYSISTFHTNQKQNEWIEKSIKEIQSLKKQLEEKPRVEIKEVEKPIHIEVEVPRPLRKFSNEEELKDFLLKDDTNRKAIFYLNPVGMSDGTCYVYASILQKNALDKGFLMSIQVLSWHEFLSWYGYALPPNQAHAICSTPIGDWMYYIEPQTDRYWKSYTLFTLNASKIGKEGQMR